MIEPFDSNVVVLSASFVIMHKTPQINTFERFPIILTFKTIEKITESIGRVQQIWMIIIEIFKFFFNLISNLIQWGDLDSILFPKKQRCFDQLGLRARQSQYKNKDSQYPHQSRPQMSLPLFWILKIFQWENFRKF